MDNLNFCIKKFKQKSKRTFFASKSQGGGEGTPPLKPTSKQGVYILLASKTKLIAEAAHKWPLSDQYMYLSNLHRVPVLSLSLNKMSHCSYSRGVESSTISFINFSILGSNKRFFNILYDGSWSESSIYSIQRKLRNKYNKVLICSFRSITGNILQL